MSFNIASVMILGPFHSTFQFSNNCFMSRLLKKRKPVYSHKWLIQLNEEYKVSCKTGQLGIIP